VSKMLRANSRVVAEALISFDELPRPGILAQGAFIRTLSLERKRTERSGRHFVLMLLESGRLLKSRNAEKALDQVLSALSKSTRETDITGWYEDGSIIGVIFTEIGATDGKSVVNALLTRVNDALCGMLAIEQINEIKISFHEFPDDWDDQNPGGPASSRLYPDLAREIDPKRRSRIVKRSMDILGSSLALVTLSPVLIVLSVLVKLTSKGPILFRQQRLGQYGHKFTFLKFRSMQHNNDHKIHEQYVKHLISGTNGHPQENGSQHTTYKLTVDPRITGIGNFLRKTSLDELPQLLNVLRGEMSLVGPRPPISYEFDCYDLWHKRRLLSVKPGITGLWQVTGRSRVKFDEMVRLDLTYASSWSPWLDLKILLRTPRAVFSGDGAY
jgi:lipopolysaccharide/colanic/teichoic acid biosynthesis glycosyltransferase